MAIHQAKPLGVLEGGVARIASHPRVSDVTEVATAIPVSLTVRSRSLKFPVSVFPVVRNGLSLDLLALAEIPSLIATGVTTEARPGMEHIYAIPAVLTRPRDRWAWREGPAVAGGTARASMRSPPIRRLAFTLSIAVLGVRSLMVDALPAG